MLEHIHQKLLRDLNSQKYNFNFYYTSVILILRKLYYGGKDALYCSDLNTGIRRSLLYQKDVFFGPIALDWVTKNLYYTEIERRGKVSFYMLKVMSAAGNDAKRAQISTSQLWELGRVHSLAVHPYRGYLFGSVFNNVKRTFQLLRFTADGKNITVSFKFADVN